MPSKAIELTWLALVASTLGGCNSDPGSGGAGTSVPTVEAEAPATPEPLVPPARAAKLALGLEHATAAALYRSLVERAGGGVPLTPATMPDWTGLWTRVGNPFFDPDQDFSQLTTAKLRPEALAELRQRRERSAQGIEYDPISDCSPPGFPRWLAIPFLREFIVTPQQVWLTSETVNNIRRIYTDGRQHPAEADAYPLWYGDSIGFWHDGTLVIHTSQVRANVFHRNDPRHSEQLETVEVWRKTDPDTMLVDVWAYDPPTLIEPWFVQQTYKRLSNDDGYLRVRHWSCTENPNNAILQTDDGSSQFDEFTFEVE
jgi:hypothetical protein